MQRFSSEVPNSGKRGRKEKKMTRLKWMDLMAAMMMWCAMKTSEETVPPGENGSLESLLG